MDREALRKFIDTTLPEFAQSSQREDAGYALPGPSLALLGDTVRHLKIRRVFEFGTGKSTRCFLDADCEVWAVEDCAAWLEQTLADIPAGRRDQLTTFHLPLETIWLAGAPLKSWKLPTPAREALARADLVLVDSPALPPFREHVLTLALSEAREALIAVDDAGIPTVRRFCHRLAGLNAAPARFLDIDHGLFFFGPGARHPLDVRRPCLETLKAWRRFFHLRTRP